MFLVQQKIHVHVYTYVYNIIYMYAYNYYIHLINKYIYISESVCEREGGREGGKEGDRQQTADRDRETETEREKTHQFGSTLKEDVSYDGVSIGAGVSQGSILSAGFCVDTGSLFDEELDNVHVAFLGSLH